MRRTAPICLLLICLAASGCAGRLSRLEPLTAAEKQLLLSGELLFPGDWRDLTPPEDGVFELTPEMQAYAERAAASARTEDRRIDAVLRSIVGQRQLGVVYDEAATLTARRVFEERRANCLSFTTLVVPMMRHVGLRVEYNDVDVPPIWNLQNTDVLVLYRHVNAIVTLSNGSREVVDFNLGEYDRDYPQRIIPDVEAAAQYYNNMGIEFLLGKQTREAFRYLRKAITMAPGVSFFWSNLGALYRQAGRLDAAETAYRAALEADPVDLVAISGAERVYLELGRADLAEEFRQRARYYRQINPYYHYTLAMNSYVQHDYGTALTEIGAAVRRFPEEHRFYFLQGAVFQALGETDKAAASLARAVELADTRKQQDVYRRKMELLQ